MPVNRLKKMLLATAAAAALVGAPLSARAADDVQALQRELDRLKGEVRQLASDAARPAYTAADVDATVDSVLRDADRRTQLLGEAGGFLGGWSEGQGFGLRSADGNYSLYTGIGFQFRSVTNLGDFGDEGESDDGFEIRRLKFAFSGNAISKNLTYNFRWAVDRSTGSPVLEEAWARYKFADQWSFRVGQIKTAADQETGISYTQQMAVDRSIVNELLLGGENYTQGVELAYEGDVVRANVAYTDGFQSRNTNFQDAGGNFGVDARVVYKVMGDWRDTTEFTAMNNKTPFLLVGVGETYTQSGDTNDVRYAVDALYKSGPLSVYGAYVGRFTSDGDDDAHDWGLIAQAGYALNQKWEVFGRYSMIKFDDEPANGEDVVHEVTAGVNYYLFKHNAKVTIDAVWLPNGSPANVTSIGVLGNDGDDQFLIRGQFQLVL